MISRLIGHATGTAVRFAASHLKCAGSLLRLHLATLSKPALEAPVVEIEANTPAGARARWVFDVVSRLHAGESVSPAEVAAHVSPEFCRPVPAEGLLDWYREQPPPAAHVAAVETESVGPTFLLLAVSLHDGRRYRWGFDTDSSTDSIRYFEEVSG